MTFSTLLVRDLPRQTYAQVYSLNLRDGGYCREWLVNARRKQHENSYAVLAQDGPRVLGWALMYQRVYKSRAFSHYDLGFYVRRDHRRAGIGGSLFFRVRTLLEQQDRTGTVYAWDKASRAFYRRHASPWVRVVNGRRKTRAVPTLSPLSHQTQ